MLCTHDRQRLDKALGEAGVETRSHLRKMIRSGQVTVNGTVCRDPGEKVCPFCDQLAVAGQPVTTGGKLYLMLNKPSGVVSATEDRREKTVLDLLPPQMRHRGLFPVGRLDKETVGLLLLTNDGALGHALTAPRRHREKVYLATVDGCLEPSDCRAFAEGIVLRDGTKTAPATLEILSANRGKVILREGKYHQVRRMLASLGKPVTALSRVEMAGVRLDPSLQPGQWRPLTEEELALIKQTSDDLPGKENDILQEIE